MSITFKSFAMVAGQIKKSSEEKEVLLPVPQEMPFAAPMDFHLRQSRRRLKKRNSYGFLCEV